MVTNNHIDIRSTGFPGFRTPRMVSRSVRQFANVFGIAPGSLRTVLSIAILIVLRHPGLAQNAIQAEGPRTPAVSAAQLNAARQELPQLTGSTLETGTAADGGTSVSSAAGTITGTVLDVNGDLIPGAAVVLNASSAGARREVTADDIAAFKFDSVTPGIPYEVTIHVKGFSSWSSPSIVLQPSQFVILSNIHLKIEAEATSITVSGSSSTQEIAAEQVHLEEQQRVLGFIPNFYAVYDGANAVPLTTKLKFKLALRVSTDPVTIMGVGLMSGIDQAADRPNYVQGVKGFGQRFGANAAGGFSDILLGGAVLPSLLHQDPRYFYQGTGGTRSRLKHAVESPFICRGDNGHRQINFSSIGGDMGATALSMTYYPSSNRGMGAVFTTFGINTVERVVGALAQEFILPHFTPALKRSK